MIRPLILKWCPCVVYTSWKARALIAGCSTKEEKPTLPPLGVTIAPVVPKDVPIHQERVGSMGSNPDAEIRPKVEGFLLTRLDTEGSYVESVSSARRWL